MVLQRRDKRRYLLVYANIQNFSDNFHQSADNLEDIALNPNNSRDRNNKKEFHNKLDKNRNTNILTPYKKTNANLYNLQFSTIIKHRFQEIFGSVEFEKANINLIHKQNFPYKNCFILRCNLKSIDKILFTISCCNPPLTTIKTSGTIRKLTAQSEIKT